MPTIISHAICGAAIAQVLSPRAHRRQLTIVASVCAMLPDLDVVGFPLGIPYGSLLGHRGLTHSILFAASAAFAVAFSRGRVERMQALLTIFAATVSHGILDAFTNGGMGVAFFSPFDTRRIFFPVRPIQVSPGAGSIDGPAWRRSL